MIIRGPCVCLLQAVCRGSALSFERAVTDKLENILIGCSKSLTYSSRVWSFCRVNLEIYNSVVDARACTTSPLTTHSSFPFLHFQFPISISPFLLLGRPQIRAARCIRIHVLEIKVVLRVWKTWLRSIRSANGKNEHCRQCSACQSQQVHQCHSRTSV